MSGVGMPGNPLLPRLGVVREVVTETASGQVRTITVEVAMEAPGAGPGPGAPDRAGLSFVPGQCAMLSAVGCGESMIAIASAPDGAAARGGRLEFTVKAVGPNTAALAGLAPGDQVGVRGPYGNGFPVGAWAGRDLVLVGGGIGMSGLRSLLWHCIHRRDHFGRLAVVSGARVPGEMCYRTELYEAWAATPGLKVYPTVDATNGDPSYRGHVGLVPAYLEELGPAALGGPGAAAALCGPVGMMLESARALVRLGWRPQDIFLSLELKMQCGIGRCGRCSLGPKLVCRDGPVFSWAELGRLPLEL